MCESEDCPTYQRTNNNGSHDNSNIFENIEEASSFWQCLWETRETGDKDADLLQEVKQAIARRVPPPAEQDWMLEIEDAVKILRKKRNFSAPGPDRLVNFWWKRASSLHEGVTQAFKSITKDNEAYPLWFAEGKTRLIPKQGDFSSENQRPITCLNNIYKWFTSCLQIPIDSHLNDYDLMEGEQRGAKPGRSGTIDNLMIDKMVTQDCHRGKRNLSMAWVDVRKAYDSVDHSWLIEMMEVHRLPDWIGKVIQNLSVSWNTRIVAYTKQGMETSTTIRFNKGLPQGDALCPRLFTLCLNPIAWLLNATEGYKLSKPLSTKVTHLLYVDDLKVFAASECKLNRVLRSACNAMQDMGLQWNSKKCNVFHVIRGKQDRNAKDLRFDEKTVVKNLESGFNYKFLGIRESVMQDEKQALTEATKVYLKRLSVMWTSPLSDCNRVIATNQFALPVLTYPMWTQHWSLAELRNIDRQTRKIISENGGRHPLSSTAVLYLPREKGGRGLRSVEQEYKLIKVKAAVKLHENPDPMIRTVQQFEERSSDKGFSSLIKDANKFAEELGITLNLNNSEPSCSPLEAPEMKIKGQQIKKHLKKAVNEKLVKKIEDQPWQGNLLRTRWQDDQLSHEGCFSWLSKWMCAPTHCIAGIMELYSAFKTGTTDKNNIICRMCGKATESLAHVLAGCSSLAQSKYLERHNAALKVLFFEMLRDLKLADKVPPWFSQVKTKPIYNSPDAEAYWDVPVYVDHTFVRSNRVDARFVDHKSKKILVVEMRCPWLDNRNKKDTEKTEKYGPLRLELTRQHSGYKIIQLNVIIDVLGGWSKELETEMRNIFVTRHKEILMRMQKAVLSCTLNVAKTFKIITF